MKTDLSSTHTFFTALQRGVRKRAGKTLAPVLRRWRHTRSADDFELSLDPQTSRFLVRYGILDAGQNAKRQRRAYLQFIEGLARLTGEASGIVEAWLNAFAGGVNVEAGVGTCGERPECVECPLHAGCRYLASGAREERLSGAALARELGGKPRRKRKTDKAAELLAFVMTGGRSGAGEVARAEALLESMKGVRGVLKCSTARLRKAGLDEDAASRLRAAAELFKLWSQETRPRGRKYSDGSDFYLDFYLRLRDARKEKFYVVCLDQKNRLLGEDLVSEGSLTEALVHPREVFAPAIRLRAAAVAVVHNHPSGDPKPSPEDKQLTKRLKQAADLVGIRLIDHVVVGDGRYVSFAEKGWL